MVTFKLNLHYVHNLKITQNCTPKDSTKQTINVYTTPQWPTPVTPVLKRLRQEEHCESN